MKTHHGFGAAFALALAVLIAPADAQTTQPWPSRPAAHGHSVRARAAPPI